MDALWQDLRYGVRALRARPGFTIVATLTLALGVGATTAIFSAVNALLLRPLPVADLDRLVYGMALREGFDPFGTSLLEYALYSEEAHSLESSGLGTPRLFSLVGSGEPERLQGSAVTVSYLTTIGVAPTLGRLFTADEDRPGGPAVALLGHGLWQRRFAGDPSVVGRTLDLEGRFTTVVGVLPPGFDLPYSAEVWVPMQASLDGLPMAQRAANANELVARLKPGVGLHQADAELKRLARRLEEEHPEVRRGWSYGIVPLRHQLIGDVEGRTPRSLVALLAAVAFLLVICCVNVASLLLARGVAREGELATRLSLGAGRGRLVRQLLTESLLLALLGGAGGVLLAFWTQPLLRVLNPVQAVGLGAFLTDFRIDGGVLAFSLSVTLLTGVLCGVVPAVKVSHHAGLQTLLKRREQRAGGATTVRRSLRALVVGEIAVAATLLVGGALTARSLLRLHELDLGFRPERLLSLELPLSPRKYASTAQQVLFLEEILERVKAVPDVEAAGLTLNLPMQQGVTLDARFEAEGHPPAKPTAVPMTAHRPVTPGYLQTLGASLLQGRFLDERDTALGLPVVVISGALAREAWPGEEAIGKRVRRIRAGEPGPWMTVVGVVRDVKEDRFSFRIDRPVWYVPYAQQTFPAPVSIPVNLVVRTGGPPASAAAAVREAVRAVDPDQPVANVMPMREYLSDVLVTERFSAILMGTLAACGLMLAAVGLYGVMAYSVGQRTGEIGLRLALGARPRDVVRLVMGDGLVVLAVGLGLGLAGAGVMARLLSGLLFGVNPTDPVTFVAVGATLATVALAACALPAHRASRLDPQVALRQE
jgi:predicted permease